MPAHETLGPSHGMHTQCHIFQNVKKYNFYLETSMHCPLWLHESRAECMQKMGHFLEAKPYFNLHETSFLDLKWTPEVPWGLRCS